MTTRIPDHWPPPSHRNPPQKCAVPDRVPAAVDRWSAPEPLELEPPMPVHHQSPGRPATAAPPIGLSLPGQWLPLPRESAPLGRTPPEPHLRHHHHHRLQRWQPHPPPPRPHLHLAAPRTLPATAL